MVNKSASFQAGVRAGLDPRVLQNAITGFFIGSAMAPATPDNDQRRKYMLLGAAAGGVGTHYYLQAQARAMARSLAREVAQGAVHVMT